MAAKPRSHTDEDKDYDDKQVYKTKTVVDSHGVKSCPSSSTDRPNDVSSLSIFPFEPEFKACLERRKQNEPQILNILFPIKTDNIWRIHNLNRQVNKIVYVITLEITFLSDCSNIYKNVLIIGKASIRVSLEKVTQNDY